MTSSRVLAEWPEGLRSNRPEPGGWMRRAFSFPAMLTGLLTVVVFTMGRSAQSDPDIWWHLRNAEYLFKTGRLPRQDMFSFTVAGQSWINHEWLAEIPYYLAWRTGGLAGIKGLEILVLEGLFLGLLYLCHRTSGNIKASVAACCFCVFLAVVSFGPRTILFGYAYLVLLLIILERFRSRGRPPLWLIPFVFCLWINTHGSWLIGLIVFSIFVAAGLVEGRWRSVTAVRWHPPQLRKLLTTWLASVAALFVNPFGLRLVLYPFDLAFRQKLNIGHVAEWVSVDFHDPHGKVVLLLLVILLGSFLLRDRHWTLEELALLVFGLYCGLTYIRFLFLLGIVSAPVLAKTLDFFPRYDREVDKPFLNALFLCLMLAGTIRYFPATGLLEQSLARDYPVSVLPYLQTHAPDGRMLNYYLWGGFLGWNDQDLKVFIDSRADVFEHSGVLQDYLDLLSLQEPEKILEKYRIRYVLFPPHEPLTYALQHNLEWKVLYSDSVSVLLEREEGQDGVMR